MKTDIEIARECDIQKISKIAESIGIDADKLEPHGPHIAKLSNELLEDLKEKKDGKLVLVTAVNPTRFGEGKTTTSVGLSQALCKLGKKSILALREPSLGPCMGTKGGAAGGGYAQVVPMEDINLHFTGDIHAVSSAHNLLSELLDNHLYHGNELNIDPRQLTWKRVMDVCDRSIRNMVIGLGGKTQGVPREDGFLITAASEVMAILCLAEDLADLKTRLSRIIVGYSYTGEAITAKQLKAQGAMAALLKDAIKPNLVQTLEHTPALIHGGPFANIAHGCNSVIATKAALKLGDIVITEAGFGADLGAEKFFDIKCRQAGLNPDAVVIVATIRALKFNGGVTAKNLTEENVDALRAGFVNLEKHVENCKKFGVPVVVTINHFPTDTDEEVKVLENLCESLECKFAVSRVWANGGEGGKDLAEKVLYVLENEESRFAPIYPIDMHITDKISVIARSIYGASKFSLSPEARKQVKKLGELGLDKLPICIAKTQYSLSDKPNLLGRPKDFDLHVRKIEVSAGAGFVVVMTGDILRMPGLPKIPSAEVIDIDKDGVISGLF